MPVVESVVGGLVVRAVGAASIRLYKGAKTARGRRKGNDLEIAQKLATYELPVELETEELRIALAEQTSMQEFELALSSDDCQAITHQVLAARLTGASNDKLVRLRQGFIYAVVNGTGAGETDGLIYASTIAFDYIDDCCQRVAEAVDKESPETLARIRDGASYSLITATLDSIDRHLESLSNSSHSQINQDRVFVDRYRRQASVAHGSITPPDFDRRRKVPVADIYVGPSLSTVDPNTGRPENTTIERLRSKIDRTVILGDPGGGKSTASSVLTHYFNTATNRTAFLVILRDFPIDAGARTSIVAHIERRLANVYQVDSPAGAIERLLTSGAAVVIFDGLDELLETSKRREMTEIVELFCNRYPLAPVLVTSRAVGYQQAPVDEKLFTAYSIGRFSPAQVQEYVSKWFAQEDDLSDKEKASYSDSFVEESSTVSELTQNPLMLSLMCIIYRGQNFIPRNRPEVYERCATMLFEKWDSSRRIHVELEAGLVIDPVLKHVAFWLLQTNSTVEGVPRDSLITEVKNYLLGRTFEDDHVAHRAATEFVDFCTGRAWVFSDAGSTADGEPLFKFTHRTFMEYFAAYQLTRESAGPRKLARTLLPRVSSGEWDVIAQLAIQIENKRTEGGAEIVFDYLMSDQRRRSAERRGNILSFIARCMGFISPPPARVRNLARQIVDVTLELAPQSTVQQAPLGTLLAEATEQRSVLVDELETYLAQLLESSTPGVRPVIWSLLVWSPILVSSYQGRQTTETRSLRDEWDTSVTELIYARRTEFVREVHEDTDLLDYAIRNGLIDYAAYRALVQPNSPDDLIRELLKSTMARAFRLMNSPILHGLVARSMPESFESDERKGNCRRFLSALIAEIIDSGEPPWIRDEHLVSAGLFIDNEVEDTSDAHLFFTSAIARGIMLELGTVEYMEIEGSKAIARLAHVREGIEKSTNLEEDLPEGLSVEQKKMLISWSRGEISFTTSQRPKTYSVQFRRNRRRSAQQ